jgi:D-alanine-D-alanine ligase
MKIGLTYDLKTGLAIAPGSPDDAYEEYDSPETVEAIEQAISLRGHDIIKLGGGHEFLTRVLEKAPDFVFNIAEGLGNYRSREAQIPAVLEMLGIPYSGSDPLCLSLCLDKPLSKQIACQAGVKTPQWQVITSPDQINRINRGQFNFPLFVKPTHEGSSKGIRSGSRAEDTTQLEAICRKLLGLYRQPIMVEEFIAGDEITVGVLDNPLRVLGVMQVAPVGGRDPDFVYSLEIKRDWEKLVRYQCPAPLPESTLHEIERLAILAFHTLGCRDVARVDFRVDQKGIPYFLEINPLPGLSPSYGDLPIMARATGYSYPELIRMILDSALKRA